MKYLNGDVFSIHLAGVLTCLLFFIQETRLGAHDCRAMNSHFPPQAILKLISSVMRLLS